ncbi:MAG: BREX-1 system adenine-specific DNA-methyltransferase PglX [Prevotella sp.]|nr:BREX-1 system adenine-specific DNA-methyltransferase PglX [Prevotella sp.]
MDTNRIKRFATEARNKLKEGISAKIRTLGFDKKGNVAEEHRPQLMQGGTHWNGQLLPETFYHQWTSLYNRIQQKGISEVYEEAAYTWFNRLCAIRILQKNDLCAPVLDYMDAARTPFIVDEARQGRIPGMNDEMRSRLNDLLDDDTKVTEQFAVLINAWCHDNPIIHRCFGAMADYTELLLPNNILTEGGFVDMLNHTDFITDADYRSPELIGWLYQFYISERKDEVFAKKGKFEADEIPAATQIFTPNWIVKYMVQNTVGRIYLDNNPYETQLQKKWQYLVEPSEKPSANSVLKYDELTDLRVADLACGSGHILNECFDLLYDLYIAEGYGRGEAIENIFRHNLTGVDLDTRAKQLATFALLLKACQKDNAFADAHCLPNVLDMPQCNRYTWRDTSGHFACWYQLSERFDGEEIDKAFQLLEQAENLGSIMKFDISDDTHNYMKHCIQCYEDTPAHTETFGLLIQGFRLILALTEKYHALVMNPPYMGSGNMNRILGNYCSIHYIEGKADLMTVFMQKSITATIENGYWSMINLPSWMFLPSFEQLRGIIINQQGICSLNYNGRGIFGSDFGSVSFVIRNSSIPVVGTYRKLFSIQGSVRSVEDIQRIFEDKHDGLYIFNQKEFLKVPGNALAFWLPMTILDSFNSKIGDYASAKKGLSTGNNNLFLRLWFEVSKKDSIYETDTYDTEKTWYPINKGGSYRKWYGNNEYVIDWKNDGERIRNFSGSVIRNPQYYLKECLTWTMLSASCFGVRYSKKGKLFEGAGPSLFAESDNIYYILAFLCSQIGSLVIRALNPTINININDVLNLPFKKEHWNIIEKISKDNIYLSMSDWDSHETSWDFETNPLLAVDTDTYIDNIHHEIERHEKETGEHICIDPAAPELDCLEWRMEQYKQKWEHLFMQLHENEEELNRQFIDIYGLQDELTPDVPLDEITILQQGEIWLAPCPGSDSMYGAAIEWNDDVVMKQFISYAVGCMMGRYRLDKKGLHIAHPNPTAEETAPYIYNNVKFEIDEDGIIPLMPNDCGFSDNASNRFADFVRIALGDEKHVENLNYVEKCLGKSVEQYFVKDFWKDHKKMYQNRPIYWLFASKKGAFQCIAYMHRMNAYTAERIRAKYLLPYIETLQARIIDLDARRSELTTRETKQLQQLTKTLEECQEYHERLQVVAEQAIAFDLDDGVVVNYAKFGDVVQKIK